MNDMTLLKAHGPAAAELPTDVRDRARAALLREIDRTVDLDDVLPAATVRRPRRLGRLALVAASISAVALIVPSLAGLDGSAAIAIVPTDPLGFPFTPTKVPAGLGDPVFERDGQFSAARYGSALNGLTVLTDVEDEDFWTIPADAPTVDVAGHQGRVLTGTAYNGTPRSAPTVAVVWETDDHDWTAVRGSGTYADAGRVEAFAESLREKDQPVDLSLSLAPEGWSVAAYKEDRILTLSPNDEPGANDLTVSLVDAPAEDLAAYGAQEVSTMTINGQPAQLGRQGGTGEEDGWLLTGHTTSGQAFSLQAPDDLTREQVIEVAEGVTYRP